MLLNIDGSVAAVSGGAGSPGGDVDGIVVSGAPNVAACIVIGGGPGGAAAATTLAQAGQDVLLFERERFPRFHIGESLLPGANSAFDVLGIRAELERRDYVVKNGATFETEDGDVAMCYCEGFIVSILVLA